MDASGASGRQSAGLFESLRTLLATLVAMAEVRLELFGNELEEEVDRIVGLLIFYLVLLALSSLALLFAALVVVAAFWDTHRLAAVVAVDAVFAALTIVAYLAARARARRPSRLLSATLGELEKDRQLLGRPRT
jgi:uncharacterized membrane protein YqjE